MNAPITSILSSLDLHVGGQRKRVFVIGVSKTLHDLKIKDAMNEIGESKLGLHCLLLYPDLKAFREFYTYCIQKQIKK